MLGVDTTELVLELGLEQTSENLAAVKMNEPRKGQMNSMSASAVVEMIFDISFAASRQRWVAVWWGGSGGGCDWGCGVRGVEAVPVLIGGMV